MLPPEFDDPEWEQRMAFLSAFTELSLENQLAFVAAAVRILTADRNNQAQHLLWHVELADRQWRVVDGLPGMRVIG